MGTLEKLIGMATGADTEKNTTFIVEDSNNKINSAVHLSPVTMEDLNIWYGVAILLEGKKKRKAICTALQDENCGGNKIWMNDVVRNKFGVSVGDSVSLGSFLEIPKGRKIVVRPIPDGSQNCDFWQENLFESYLRPYFYGAHRPVNNGDVFSVKGPTRTIEFKIIKTIPSPFCIVGPATIITCEEHKVASKRRKKAAVGSKSVKGPQIAVQSFEGSPVPDPDAMPVQTAEASPERNADALPLQNGETSSAPQNENEAIKVGKEIKVSEGRETTLEDKIKLAYSLQKQGELQKAKHAFVDVINTQNEKPGHSHPDMLPIKRTLATILFDLKQFHRLAYLLLIDQELQNTWDRDFMDIKLWVAMLLTSKNKYEAAEGILFGATEHIRSMEFSFVERLKIKVGLASVLYCRNKFKLALKHLSDNQFHGPRFLDKKRFELVLKNLNNLANLKLHSKYLDVLFIKYNIGWFYYKLEDYILATETLQAIIPIMKGAMGSDHLGPKLAEDLLEVCKEQMLPDREQL